MTSNERAPSTGTLNVMKINNLIQKLLPVVGIFHLDVHIHTQSLSAQVSRNRHDSFVNVNYYKLLIFEIISSEMVTVSIGA
jgi:hypothetical protein